MLETALGLFALGTVWFWLLFVGSSIAIIAFLENEKAWASTVTFVLTVAAMIGLGNMGFLGWVLGHPLELLIAALLYFVLGTIYGVVKWWLFVTNIKERYIEEKAKFIEELEENIRTFEKNRTNSLGHTIQRNLNDEAFFNDAKQTVATGKLVGKIIDYWREHVNEYDEECRRPYPNRSVPDYKKRITKPLVRNHKGRVIAWMSYWPWSLFWTILNDPIRRLMRRIYYRIKGILQGISDRVFKDIDAELADPVEKKEETE